MEQREFIELIRLAYLAGVNDSEEEAAQWCEQGSNERAHELVQEFIDSGDMTHEFN